MVARLALLASMLAVLTVAMLPAEHASAGRKACRGADTMPTGDNARVIRAATRCLINRERRARGRPGLRANGHLTRAAQAYSAQMVSQGFFDHVSPDGATLRSRIRGGTRYLVRTSSYRLGENLAWGSGRRTTPRQIVRSWMRSPSHRRNVLDRRFRELGVGVVLGAPVAAPGTTAATYTTEFGRRS